MDVRSFLKRNILRVKYFRRNVRLGARSDIAVSSTFEGCNRVGKNTFFCGSIGYASYIGNNCHIVAHIGRYCCIAPRVVTVRGNHPIKDWVSVHPAFFSTAKQCGMTFVNENKYTENKSRVVIGNDVWIGDSAILMDGITIGDGAVIGAGAVVTKDVAPYSIVAGVPAKEIKKRFSDEEIARLLELEWWNMSTDWIKKNAGMFSDAKSFLKTMTFYDKREEE